MDEGAKGEFTYICIHQQLMNATPCASQSMIQIDGESMEASSDA
jgi:hypothetical protein